MIRKLFFTLSAAFIIGTAGTSCSEDIPECPTKLCVLAGGWKLVEVELDGEVYTGDYSKYELVLSDPSPDTETSSSFTRINISGNSDSGTWSIENTNPAKQDNFSGSVLRLRPGSNPLLQEDWNIESFTPRQMVLIMNRDVTAKDGPATIRFVLEPF